MNSNSAPFSWRNPKAFVIVLQFLIPYTLSAIAFVFWTKIRVVGETRFYFQLLGVNFLKLLSFEKIRKTWSLPELRAATFKRWKFLSGLWSGKQGSENLNFCLHRRVHLQSFQFWNSLLSNDSGFFVFSRQTDRWIQWREKEKIHQSYSPLSYCFLVLFFRNRCSYSKWHRG